MLTEERITKTYPLGLKLWWLILGRLATALVLLLARAFWIRSTDQQSWNKTLQLLAIVAALSIGYSLLHRISKNFVFQTRLQFVADVLLVTWLVWTTDVIHSPYTALYIVIISTSSIFLGPRDAVVSSVGCAVAFTGCALAVMAGLGDHPARELLGASLSQTIQAVGLFDIAFLVVGLLSARLAERQSRSDVRLIAATQSLANLRALHERIVQSIRSGVVTTDLRGRIYTFNAAAEEITGYKEVEVRGQDASIFFGALGEHRNKSLRAAQTGGTNPRFEADCLTAEGLRLRLGFTISPLFAETGETTGSVITFLRTEMDGQSSQTELMEIILRESDRLNRIISDFLTYARPRSITRSSVDVGELLKQTFTLLRHSTEITSAQIIEERIPNDPCPADADAEQLQQVFWNLARNALQAMPEGGTLRAELARNSNNRLRISFSDTGRGMAPEQVEHLFEPFSSTTGGTGLGLSIVYQIIRDHGGTINVRSMEGQGTTIMIELPAEAEKGD